MLILLCFANQRFLFITFYEVSFPLTEQKMCQTNLAYFYSLPVTKLSNHQTGFYGLFYHEMSESHIITYRGIPNSVIGNFSEISLYNMTAMLSLGYQLTVKLLKMDLTLCAMPFVGAELASPSVSG